MSRFVLKSGTGFGTWRRMGRRVFITCGQCGAIGQIDHEVDDQGNVNPSLVCPDDACNWHVWGALEGWAP